MTKFEAIQKIESTYPADRSDDGVMLLNKAKAQINNWRKESPDVLIRYAELCEELSQKEDAIRFD
jgi:hypothetical protein